MAKTKKIFFPRTDGDVTPYVINADKKLTEGGLGVKYEISTGDMTKSANFKANIPVQILKAVSDAANAKSSNATKDEAIHDANLFYNNLGHQMQRHTNYDPADLEGLSFFKQTAAVDLDAVKPVVSKITLLPEKIILDWIRAGLDGVYIESMVVLAGNMFPADASTTGWVKLGEDDRSPYEDERINQNNHPETRYYRLRYKKDNKPVGLYSEIYKAIAEIYN